MALAGVGGFDAKAGHVVVGKTLPATSRAWAGSWVVQAMASRVSGNRIGGGEYSQCFDGMVVALPAAPGLACFPIQILFLRKRSPDLDSELMFC